MNKNTMEKTVLLQQQIRNNSDELFKEYLDLKAWEQEMKRKDEEIKSSEDKETLPPVRSKKSKSVNPVEVEKEAKPQRIKSFDYQAWETFDVDKACKEIESSETEKETEEDTDTDTEEEPEEAEITELTQEEYDKMYEEATELKVQGNQHVQKQNWNQAIDCYTKAIKIFNGDAVFYANRALCYLKIDNLYSAEADCTVAIQLDANYVKAYHRRAQARMELKQYEDAKRDIEKLLELEPSNKAASSMLLKLDRILNKKKTLNIVKDPKVDDEIPIEENIDEKLMMNEESCGIKIEYNEEKSSEKIVENLKVVSSDIISEDITRFDAVMEECQNTDGTNIPLWLQLDDEYEIINSLQKAPHRRSQISMKKIPVTEVNLGDNVMSKSFDQLKEESRIIKQCSIKTAEPSLQPKQNKNPLLIEVINEDYNEDFEIPPAPTTSVQFNSDWNKTKSFPIKYKYLKQIMPKDLPSLFQHSLESDTLSNIIQTLSVEFIKRKEPVYDYLDQLANVPRFRALILFLNKKDKVSLDKLFNYIKTEEKKSEEVVASLRQIYEL